jgi:cysteine desulfurase
MNRIYLDNAATTPLDTQVIEEMNDVMQHVYANPSSVHQSGAAARDRIENARLSIASSLSVEPSEIFFTSGATESINTLIEGSIHSLNLSHIISSDIEHPAVIQTIERSEQQHGVKLLKAKFDQQGQIDLHHLEELLQQHPKAMVCLNHVNNELGTILPLEKVGQLCKDYGALFLSDTVQSVGKYAHNWSHGLLDFAVGSAHKFHGPKGVGFMYINGNNKIYPRQIGGAQERNMRAGTENLVGIVGMAKAMEIAYADLEKNTKYIQALKDHLLSRIEIDLPDVIINGDPDGAYSIVNLGFPKQKHNKMLIFNLDVAGIAVSGGSACSSGVMNISHVIKALGRAESHIPVRISMSKYNTKEEIDYLIEVLKKY